MRGQTATGIGLGAIAGAGAALVTMGVAGHEGTLYKAGLAVLIVGLACMMMHVSRCNTRRLIAHQQELVRASKEQRQEWAQRGYRAGEIDTLHRLGRPLTEAQILEWPRATDVRRHRSGT